MLNSVFLLAALLASPLLAKPVELQKRGAVLTGQFQSESELSGMYTLYNNLWGEASATSGSQTTQESSASGTSVAWETTWNWAGGSSSVKSCKFTYLHIPCMNHVHSRLCGVEGSSSLILTAVYFNRRKFGSQQQLGQAPLFHLQHAFDMALDLLGCQQCRR